MNNPEEIELITISKKFQYERDSRLIEQLGIEELKNMCKMYLKLYLAQSETLGGMYTPSA